jgi:hypothetical protein
LQPGKKVVDAPDVFGLKEYRAGTMVAGCKYVIGPDLSGEQPSLHGAIGNNRLIIV